MYLGWMGFDGREGHQELAPFGNPERCSCTGAGGDAAGRVRGMVNGDEAFATGSEGAAGAGIEEEAVEQADGGGGPDGAAGGFIEPEEHGRAAGADEQEVPGWILGQGDGLAGGGNGPEAGRVPGGGVEDGELIAFRDGDEEAGAGAFDEDGSGMGGEADVAAEAGVGDVDDGEFAVVEAGVLTAVADVEGAGAGVVIEQVSAFGEREGVEGPERRAVEDAAEAVLSAGDEEAVGSGVKQDALGLGEAGDGAEGLLREIDLDQGVGAEGGEEDAVGADIDGEMIEAAGDAGERDAIGGQPEA